MPLLGQVDVDLNTSHFCPTDLGTQVLGWIWWVLSVHYLACTWPLNPQLGPLPGVASSNLCTELLQPLPPATPLSMSCGCRWLLPHQGSNLILPQILVPSASSGRKSGQEWGLEREGENPPPPSRPPLFHIYRRNSPLSWFFLSPVLPSLPLGSALPPPCPRGCPLPSLQQRVAGQKQGCSEGGVCVRKTSISSGSFSICFAPLVVTRRVLAVRPPILRAAGEGALAHLAEGPCGLQPETPKEAHIHRPLLHTGGTRGLVSALAQSHGTELSPAPLPMF